MDSTKLPEKLLHVLAERFKQSARRVFPAVFLFTVSASCFPAPAGAADWHVADAPLRCELTLADHPTHSSAGYFLCLPDGGILPGPAPVSRVVTERGRAVESYLLWHNPKSFAGLVFADPGAKDERVFMYFTGKKDYRLWQPSAGLTPSSILITEPGKSKLADAQALGAFGRVGQNVRFWNAIGPSRAPLSIGGDLSGRPRPGVFYLLAYLSTWDPGRTWVAPFTLSGETEVRVNGETIVPRQRIDKWGGTGQWVDIKDGSQRLEVFQTAPGAGDYFTKQTGGLMFLTWRTPNADAQELGGIRSDNVPMAGTPRMETRVLRGNEIVRSGGAVVAAVRSRDGGPVAFISAAPANVFWFDKETPLLLYKLDAVCAGNSPDTRYTWLFEDGAQTEGANILWLLPGLREHKITLSAAAGARKSKTALPVYAFAHAATSLNNPEHRQAYRQAITQMLRAYEKTPEKIAQWDAAYWNNLLRSLEFGSGYALLRELFSNYAEGMRARLSGEQVVALQELFLDAAAGSDQRAALEWVQKFHDETTDDTRRKQLVIRQAEIYAYYRNDLKTARKLLAPLAQSSDAIGQLAQVRLGDIAFLGGDINLATRRYANIQNLARHKRAMFAGVYDALAKGVADKPRETRSGGSMADKLRAGLVKITDAVQQQRQKSEPAARAGGGETNAPPPPSARGKIGALLDASASENVRRLTEDGYLLEARQALNAWEMELPLSKISGDYILLESRFYRQAGDPRRAYGMLRAYCDQVDASSYLPEAAKVLLECMVDLKMPPGEIRAYGRKLCDRLEFHPAARELKFMMEYGE
ncbi:MAG: hypothetical protein PHP98_04755 [Kiritimatiellae bacterium]|nr:hypothetical protein [Kiritimatiellia bacterium]